MKVVNISILLSLLSRLLQRINNKKVLNPVINFLDQEVNEYYGVTLDWNYIFQKNFNRQLVLSHIVKLIIKLKKPKLLIHTDNGSMNAVNKMAFNMNIETIDFQHAITTSFHVVYTHRKDVSKEYKTYLSKYFFSWGEYFTSRLNKDYICRVVGNPYHETSKQLYQDVEIENSILIISDDQMTRRYLEELALYLAKNLSDFQINYKLRPEEYLTWKDNYSISNSRISNLNFIDNDSEHLYSYLKKSQYVIGTSSSVLVEAIDLSEALIYEFGWFEIMKDYIQDGFIKSFKEKHEILDYISKPKVNQYGIGSKIFASNPSDLMKKNIDKLIKS